MLPTPSVRALGAAAAAVLLCFSTLLVPGCRNDINDPQLDRMQAPIQASTLSKKGAHSFEQVNLVANDAGYNPQRVDAALLNAWGIAITPTGILWLSANHAGVSVVYDTDGNAKRAPVTVPAADSAGTGSPTGVVFNATSDFLIPGTTAPSRFIFASEDGVISAWSGGNAAVVVADRSSADAVYKGLALARHGDRNLLYATNFKGGAVEVFDAEFHQVPTHGFRDRRIPAGYAPFGIQNVDGKLFVTFAKQKGPDNEDDESGPGNGFVDVFNPDGKLLDHFAARGALNSPWGIASVPDRGFRHLDHSILIGNFGDGRINIFDKEGKYRGQLSDSAGHPITIPGLWGLMFRSPAKHTRGEQAGERLFFTAGPNDENDGVFGYLKDLK